MISLFTIILQLTLKYDFMLEYLKFGNLNLTFAQFFTQVFKHNFFHAYKMHRVDVYW